MCFDLIQNYKSVCLTVTMAVYQSINQSVKFISDRNHIFA